MHLPAAGVPGAQLPWRERAPPLLGVGHYVISCGSHAHFLLDSDKNEGGPRSSPFLPGEEEAQIQPGAG